MARCPGALRGQVPLPEDRSFSGYVCPPAPFTRLPYYARSGIATAGFAERLRPSTPGATAVAADLSFVCHFYIHRTPDRQSFSCADPTNCRIQGLHGTPGAPTACPGPAPGPVICS
ncbi:uncharacterized protein LOC129592382 [Paramacrobiotus metropolitanus]|uniref:uncharacterized protein LOC129592382 n=1 Tax=Paramacrobiotus metropolitanus TaxID=2943436 RepID=UPI0024460093|nr:uncharacterized protein LOC129592382 [Paramacrobiotus metropolitanus]